MSGSTTGITHRSRIRLAVAALATFLGGLGTIAGAAIIIYALGFGGTEGDAMFAGAGIVLLVVALPILAVGLVLWPRRGGTPQPHDPAA
jgi:hypothetical protein